MWVRGCVTCRSATSICAITAGCRSTRSSVSPADRDGALFDNILVFENYPIDQALRGENESGRRFGRVEQVSITNYALTVAVFAKTDGINLGFRYDRGRFDEDQIRYLQACLSRLLAEIVADASRPLGELGGLDADQMRKVLGWSGEHCQDIEFWPRKSSPRSRHVPQLRRLPSRWCLGTSRSAIAI